MSTKLGQNFLINKEIAKRIVQAADLKSDDIVLEIGPGRGMLTEQLAKKAGKVVAVEIDKDLVELLKNKFLPNKNTNILEADILRNFDLSFSNFDKLFKLNIKKSGYKIVANLPYYITSPIIRKFLENDFPPKTMVLMVQKEVAERICAKPGEMSILAVSVQYYAEPQILFHVDRKNFEPMPEVDSAVIKIIPSLQLSFHGKDEAKKFFRVVRAGFCAKRKTLANNLANSFHIERKLVEEKIKKVGLKPTVRAQELNLESWKKLALDFK